MRGVSGCCPVAAKLRGCHVLRGGVGVGGGEEVVGSSEPTEGLEIARRHVGMAGREENKGNIETSFT